MPEARLNVAALRLRRLPGARLDNDPGRSLTRRELFGAAGAAAAVISPAVAAIGDTLHGPFQLRHGNGRAAFEFAGQDRWVVDSADFGGTPHLLVEQADRLIRLSLTGATYPGTDLPADFTCEIKQGLTGWKMKLRHSLGGFSGQAPFERWLLGQADLESAVKVKAEVCSLGGEAPVRLAGRAHAQYRPDGEFRYRGDAFAEIEGENPLAGDHVELTLLRASDPSVFEKPASSRTLLTLHRDGRHWPLRPVADDLPAGELTCNSDAFDTLHVEIAPGKKAPSVALLAESGTSRSEISYRPHPRLQSSDYSPFELRLRNARYAVAFEPEGPRTALIADYDGPSWMHGDGCSVLVGDGPNAAPFEIVGRSGKTESMTVSPALLGFVAPLSGAVVEPSPMPEGETITFEPEQVKAQSQLRPQAGISQINKVKLNPEFAHIGLMAPGRVRVIRPEDMLALEFQFFNMEFRTGPTGPSMVRRVPAQAAYLVVHFPPQHINEEAVFDAGGSGAQTPPPQMRTRMAGPSRLAFLVPTSVTSIPYTIDGLLDWAKLVPSVVPIADPPPPPFRFEAITVSQKKNPIILAIIGEDQHKRVSRSIVQDRNLNFAQLATHAEIKRPNMLVLSPQTLPPIQATKPGITIGPNITALLASREVREPSAIETDIEAPWRLHMSPHDLSGWKHESDISKVTHNGRSELWHTRLGTLRSGKVVEDDDYYRTMRAIWSPDYKTQSQLGQPHLPDTVPFLCAIAPRDRHEIVRQTADFLYLGLPAAPGAKGKRIPKPVSVDQFMMSSLGAWIDLEGKWDAIENSEVTNSGMAMSLSEWSNRSTMGRDHFVKIVREGYLLPFGHRAALVKITERKLVPEQGPPGQRFYVLQQRQFIVVREPEKVFPDGRMRDGGNRFPFTSVVIKTRVTPKLQPAPPDGSPYVPIVIDAPFRFHMRAVDKSGEESDFTMPLMFMEVSVSGPVGVAAYNTRVSEANRRADMSGQKVAFARPAVHGDTSLDTQSIVFSADNPTAIAAKVVPFRPAMAYAKVNISAARAMADVTDTPRVEFPEIFYLNEFAPTNKGQIYLQVINPVALSYQGGSKSEKTGGMCAPDLSITAISRKFGPVGGPVGGKPGSERDLPGGSRGPGDWDFDPKKFFSDKAKLLGFLLLSEIIPKEPIGDGKSVPKLTTKTEEDRIITTLDWNPKVTNLATLFVPSNNNDCLTIHAEIVVFLAAKEPTYKILGQVKDFKMNIFDCIALEFAHVKFTTGTGEKTDVDPKFKPDGIQFIGPLSFVNKLKDILPGGGGGDGGGGGGGGGAACAPEGERDLPAAAGLTFDYFIDPSPLGIQAGFTIGIPTIAVGVFSLQNIAVGAAVDIPFTGEPVAFTFNFCSRDNPFLLSVWIIGGGGWFNITVTTKGIKSFEGSFQLGVTAAIDIGIASGGVSIMAGVTYRGETKEPTSPGAVPATSTELVGYLEANGWVDVLGLISASLELYLGLTYANDGAGTSSLWGRATISFTIEILFFSFTVSAAVEKRFAGSGSGRALPVRGARGLLPSALGGGVKFEQVISEPEWNEYCLAFA